MEDYYDIIADASKGDEQRVREAIRLGANVNCHEETSWDTPLHFATRWYHKKVVKILLANGADVNSRNRVDDTPLHISAVFGWLDIAWILIKKGADLNAKNSSGETPLHIAEKNKKAKVVKLLHKYEQKKAKANIFFPVISQEYLHNDFGDFDDSPPEDPNAPRVKDGADYFNNKDYEKALSIITAALKSNPNEYERSVAYDIIGIIEIKRGNLLNAINNFLACLKLHKRDRFHTWQSAKYLYYIYSEAKLSDSAKALQQLSEIAVEQYEGHSTDTEKEVRNLTRQTLKLLMKS